jgi:osmoprotectant transport system permease protein
MIGEVLAWFTDPANWQGPGGVATRVAEHVGYTMLALVVGAAIAVPLGVFVGHTGRGGVGLVALSNAIRALPTLGLVTFLFLLFTHTEIATIVGLVILAIPPILAGTYAGVQAIDPSAVDAGEGMGMTGRQRLWLVEVPIALPLVLGGVRNAVLQLVATAAVAAYVGLGGLGRFLLDGLAVLDYSAVVAGAMLTGLLAVVLDLVFACLQRAVVPAGVRLAAASQQHALTRGQS